jgi:hypothetical protein
MRDGGEVDSMELKDYSLLTMLRNYDDFIYYDDDDDDDDDDVNDDDNDRSNELRSRYIDT